jgi:hypothetical protein
MHMARQAMNKEKCVCCLGRGGQTGVAGRLDHLPHLAYKKIIK